MLPERKEEALKILKQAELNHKNLKIIISGSFLYQKKYNVEDAHQKTQNIDASF